MCFLEFSHIHSVTYYYLFQQLHQRDVEPQDPECLEGLRTFPAYQQKLSMWTTSGSSVSRSTTWIGSRLWPRCTSVSSWTSTILDLRRSSVKARQSRSVRPRRWRQSSLQSGGKILKVCNDDCVIVVTVVVARVLVMMMVRVMVMMIVKYLWLW